MKDQYDASFVLIKTVLFLLICNSRNCQILSATSLDMLIIHEFDFRFLSYFLEGDLIENIKAFTKWEFLFIT
jgi:hypothetical protein